MSAKPPLTAALKRLTAYADWDGDTGPNPYNDSDYTLQADLQLALRAINVLDNAAQHADDRDMMPVFEISVECMWKQSSKGLIHCIGMALVNEDAPDGAIFQ